VSVIVISEGCAYGDYRGLFNTGHRSISCSQIGSEAPYKCYQEDIAADCCETCSSIRRTDKPGIEHVLPLPSYILSGPHTFLKLALYRLADRTRNRHTATGNHMPYGITHSAAVTFPPLLTAEAFTQFSGRMQGWVDLVMVISQDSLPAKYPSQK